MVTIGSLFSGGGGWDAGARELGVEAVFAVEMDARIAAWHSRVFGGHTLVSSVADVDWDEVARVVGHVDILVSSPPCQEYTKSGAMQEALAKKRGTVRGDRSLCDPMAGIYTINAVDALRPLVVFLEEAPSYATRASSPFGQIVQGLLDRGYTVDWKVLRIQDYGLPSARERLFMRATLGGKLPPWPAKQPRVTWYEAIRHMIPSLPLSELSPRQKRDLAAWGMPRRGEPLIITGGQRGSVGRGETRKWFSHRASNELSWAIQKAKGMGGMRVVDERGDVRQMTPRAVSVLQGFPASYPIEDLGKTRALDILGNSVPPLIAMQLIAPFLARGR